MARKFLYLILFSTFIFTVIVPIGEAGQDDERLNKLFIGLATTADAQAAKSIEAAIWDIWVDHKKPPIKRVLDAGIQAMNSGAMKTALEAFDDVVKTDPNFAEGWNKRATIYYVMQDYQASVKDIAQTLKLEPRHFGALSGLGLINIALGRHQAALMAFEKALEVHPHMISARHHIKILKEILKGEET